MRKFSALVLFIFLFFISINLFAEQAAPPLNDDPCGAFELPLNSYGLRLNHENATLTKDVSAPGCAASITADVWYYIDIPPSSNFQYSSEIRINIFASGNSNLGAAIYTDASWGGCNELVESSSNCYNIPNVGGVTFPYQFFSNNRIWLRLWSVNSNSIGEFRVDVLKSNEEYSQPCNALNIDPYEYRSVCKYYPFSMYGTTSTPSMPDPICTETPIQSNIWFTSEVFSSTMVIDTKNENLNTFSGGMAVYTGNDCNNLTLIACQDTSNSNFYPQITLNNLTVGSRIWIRFWDDNYYGSPPDSKFGICLTYPSNPTDCLINNNAKSTIDSSAAVCSLNQFCGTTSKSYIRSSWPELESAFVECNAYLDNNAFLRFIPLSSTIDFKLYVKSSKDSGGVQVLIFGSDSPGSGPVTKHGCYPQFKKSEYPYYVKATDMIPGKMYYMMIDGFAGDVCDYQISSFYTLGNIAQFLFPKDTVYACGRSYKLDAGHGFTSYKWSTGASTQTIDITNSGWYKCTATINGCTGTDSVYVSFFKAYLNNKDTTVCTEQNLRLNFIAQGTNVNYLWSTGAKTSAIDIAPKETTQYFINATNGINTCKDSVTITVKNCFDICSRFKIVNNDTTICRGATVKLLVRDSLFSNGLIGYWPFNGNANDESGNGNNGTAIDVFPTADRFGNANSAYSFNSFSSYIKTQKSGPLGNPKVSTSFWLAPSPHGVSNIIGWGNNAIAGNDFSIVLNSGCNNSMGFSNYNSSTDYQASIMDGNSVWDHYVVVYDGELGNKTSSAVVYKNGVKVLIICNNKNDVPTNISGQFPITFGKYHGTNLGNYYEGKLDDIHIYNRVLSPNEVNALFNEKKTTYRWSNGATTPTIDVSPTQTTTYYVTVSNGIDSCRDSVTITVIAPPVATVNSATVCTGQIATITATTDLPGNYTYSWTVPSGASNPGNTATFGAKTAGTYTVVVTNVNTSCSSASASGTVTLLPLTIPTFTQVASVCIGANFNLPNRSTNGISGSWLPAINNLQTTTYTFTPNAGQCASTTTMTVVVNPNNTVTSINPRTVCVNTFFTNTHTTTGATGIGTAIGLPTGVTASWGNNTITVRGTPTTIGTFNYRIPLIGGCGNVSASGTITVNPRITPVFNQINPVCQGTSFVLPSTSTNGITGTWSPAINIQTTTTYTFTPTPGLCANTTSMTVQVVNCSPLSLIVSKVNGQCGNNVDVPVRVSGFRNILSMQASINWSPNDLRFEGISGFGAPVLAMNISNFGTTQTSQGRLAFSWNDISDAGVTLPDTTTIFTIRFTALGTQSRVVPVNVSNTPLAVEFIDNSYNPKAALQVNGNVNLNCIVTIAGRVITPLQQGVNRSTVAINGTGVGSSMLTDINGNYSFRVLAGTYTVTPSKNNEVNKINGISTFDIALIQSHILGRNLLNAPYKIIAADVNGSNTVTTLDINYIRKLILGLDTAFPGNRTWAFVPQSHTFANPQNPFPYPSSSTLTTFNDIFNANFIGMKIGDVNYDRNPALDRRSEQESALRLYYEEEALNSNEMILHVKVKEGRILMGTQFTLGWDQNQWSYAGIANNQLGIHVGDRWKNEGALALSWNDEQSRGISLESGQELFAIRLKRKGNAQTFSNENLLNLSSDRIEKEAFDASYRKMNVTLERRGGTNMQVPVTQIYFKAYPNPASDVLQINYGAATGSRGEIRLLDMQGRIVYSKAVGISAGDNRYDINLSNTGISAGSYVLKLQSGNTEQQVRVVVVR